MAEMKAYAREYTNRLVKPERTEFALTLKNLGTIDQETILEEAADHSRLDVDTLRHALNALTDAAVLYLKVGHGVQFGNFGSLQPSINAKAVTRKEDCTVKTMIGGVKINMQPTGTFAKAIAAMKVRLVSASTATTSEGSDDNSDIVPPDDNEGENGGQTGGGEQGGGSEESGTYRITYKFADDTEDDTEYAVGATITYPANSSGYKWPDSKPTVMPAQNVTVTEELIG